MGNGHLVSPAGVRIDLGDGKELPVEVQFEGYDSEHCPVWRIVTTDEVARVVADDEVHGLHVAFLPPHCSLLLPFTVVGADQRSDG